MNLNELFAHQRELDAHIVEKKGLQGKNLLEDKVVALICELYECVNESRHFKFWSDDQEPRTAKHKFERSVDSLGNIETLSNPLLEEYVDVVHFMLSIANDVGYTSHEYEEEEDRSINELILIITVISAQMSRINEQVLKEFVSSLFNKIIAFGYKLGFTESDVINAYHDKNKENHNRQEGGY